jgi:predicted dehydrogenase
MVRWGVLSTGGIANDFTLALKKTPKAVLHACASRSQASADEFATKHGFAKAYASYEALLADPAVEIVYIATPHSFHCDNILMCLEAGKHVLSEKPMVVNSKQAEQCIAKAKEKGLFLMEGMWTRFFPTTRAVRKLVQEGAIGKVISVTASLGFKSESHFNERLFKPQLAGGALFDVGIYPALWISMVLGTPSKVRAHARMHEEGVDAQTFVTFEYDSGAMAHLECGFTGSLPNEVAIVGETGYIKVSRPTQAPESYTLVTRQGEEPDPLLMRGKVCTVATPLDPPHNGNAPGYNFVGSQGFVYEATAVQEALEQGLTEHPEMPLSETLSMAKVFDDIRAQIGLRYPWDGDHKGASGSAAKRQRT